MAAGLGFKTFTTGEVLTAADTNGYLMQGVLVFASSAARAAAITSPQEGQYSYLKDTNSTEYYDGAAWIAAPIGDITGVTAGVGITGGGTSGTVTVTNDMATTITAAGDIVVGTGSGTYDNLPIGTTGQLLTADTTVSPYKVKWSTVATGPTFVGCQATATATTQSYTQWVRVPINFPTETFDSNGFHDNSTNNSRITIPTGYAGKYLFYGSYSIGTVPSQAFAYLTKNGALLPDAIGTGGIMGNTYGNSNQIPTGMLVTTAAVGDYFELNMYGDYATGSKTVYANLTCVYLGA
jgi:hypothetical protein